MTLQHHVIDPHAASPVAPMALVRGIADALRRVQDTVTRIGGMYRDTYPGFEQDVLGFVGAQDVVDEVGGEGDLAARLALARVLTLDEAADDGDLGHQNFWGMHARF